MNSALNPDQNHTMATIRKLPDLLVNKIAAGEVIERPASVVKELVENALDAGATAVRLAIEDGGRKLLRVSDDGSGITQDQLLLAVTPHATSKLQQEEDLFHIHTLGFRGEALASIGAVSHLRISSRVATALEGGEIYVAGERVEHQGLVGCPVGTTVEVRDLFFNVPARRKFLKSAQTELGHIQEQLARLALPHPDVEFELLSGGRQLRHLHRSTDPRQRIRDLHGDEFLDDLLAIERDEHGLRITGFIAKPGQNRISAAGQYLFLNGRYIRDRYLQHAIREAYRGLLEPSRHPILYLHLSIDPEQVDVNVHPTKIEVRWQDHNLVYSQVLSALREVLLQHDLTPAMHGRRAEPPLTGAEADEQRRRIADFFKGYVPSPSPAGWPVESSPTTIAFPGNSPQRSELALEFQSPPPPIPGTSFPPITEAAPPVIQLHRTYLVTETPEGMLVIDQHALHERIIYDQLRQRIAGGTLESQRLLIPEPVSLQPAHIDSLLHHEELLARLGIELSTFGPETIAVNAFPAMLNPAIIVEFMTDLADRLLEASHAQHTEVLIHEVLDMMACKAAVKAGDPLTLQEMATLIEQRHLIEKGSNCPHGRPTSLRFTLADLERQFKRT
ncbi:MAG: DNA mismatch repair protein MutL [Phycisphaerae bacterium]|nr:DNA mismatch repair protein MutL [Phycisphaerae bacterium]